MVLVKYGLRSTSRVLFRVHRTLENGLATPSWTRSTGLLLFRHPWLLAIISLDMSLSPCTKPTTHSVSVTRHLQFVRDRVLTTTVYPECAQFTITGSGTVSPPTSALLSFPGAYSASDPGINFNIDSDAAKKATTYVVPGGAVWDGTGSAQPAPADPTTAPTAAPTTLVTSTVPEPTTPVCSAKKFQQCGGIGFDGCKTCEAGSSCKSNGDYYSQCL